MLESYAAILKGDRLEWVGNSPSPEIQQQPVAVEVRITRDQPDEPIDADERRRRLIGALERIAARGTLDEIEDPISWQTEIRQDRPLPGRE